MAATMYGCEIVCPSPMGSGLSAYASFRNLSRTNLWRGTAAIASRTRGEETPRLRIWVSIIMRRSAADASRRDSVLPMSHYIRPCKQSEKEASRFPGFSADLITERRQAKNPAKRSEFQTYL